MNPRPPARDWRSWLRRKIGWLLAFKVAALAVLWLMFFSPAHRVDVDGDSMRDRLAPDARDGAAATTSIRREDSAGYV